MFKRSLSILLAFLVVITIFTAVPSAVVSAAADGIGYYRIQTSEGNLRIRKSPSTTSTQLGSIPSGVTVNVTEISGNWGKTTYNNITGWISLDYAVKTNTPPSSGGTGSKAILARLDELRAKFPNGKYWNHYGSSQKNLDGWTNTPCPSGHYLNGVQQCNGQCDGFARKLGLDLFGLSTYSWEKTSYSIDTICVGDLIRYNGKHTIMVIGFTENRNQLIIADCNWDYHCVIRWDALFSTSRYFRTVNWVLHYPGNNFTRDVYLGKSPESLTINKTSASLSVGNTTALSVTMEPDLPFVDVTWSSSDSNVAKVDQKGTVTAQVPGSATITAKAGNKTVTCKVTVTSSVDAGRIYGTSRLGTALEISKTGWSGGTQNVILTNAYSFADALAGVPLSKALDAPILLTANTDSGLEAEVLAQITTLGAKNIYILGGTLAVSDEIKTALEAKGLTTERLSGPSRFDTAVAIAQKLEELVGPADEIFFTNAYSFADALSVGSAAALGGDPILYALPSGELYGTTDDFVTGKSSASAVVVGGSLSVDDAVMTNLENCGVNSVSRLYGTSRFDTCVAVLNKYSSRFATNKTIYLATGYSFPDALAGGALAAKQGIPLILAGGIMPDGMKTWLKTAGVTKIRAFGGPLAVSDAALYQFAYKY